MRIGEILKSKGTNVVGLPPTSKVSEAISLMRDRNVGSVVVRDLHRHLLGILSERDIVLAIAQNGVQVANMYVTQLMATGSPIASVNDRVVDVMETITNNRVRHLPVIDRETDVVVGVVSIGDIVKARLAETKAENAILHDIARAHLMVA